ncbi:MORF4L1 [Cordylochernes scorpioides]|uniref:MORF4L1 n=1 Tax=Cordylochernes scorpioides TaxID=51811 RepID=A0ABY6LUS7_9ARAC|nr:MORF4L1 [Cordylochernes scorpioides]
MTKRRTKETPIQVSDASRFKYQDKEKVLCFYENSLYDVITMSQFILYTITAGGKNWDQWVEEGHIFKYNDNNLRLQKELEDIKKKENAHPKSKTYKKRKSKNKSSPVPAQIEEALSENLDVPTSSCASACTSAHSSSTPVRSSTSASATHSGDGNQAAIPKISPNDASTQKTLCASSLLATPASSAPTPPRTPANATRTSENMDFLTPESTSAASCAPAEKKKRQSQQLKKKSKYVPTEEPPFLTNKNIRINFTEQMKKWLFDDSTTITKLKRLYKLPAKVSVDKLLKRFIKYKKERDNIDKEAEKRLVNYMNIINVYFNGLLEKMLLYNSERSQYKMYIQSQAKPASQIYGGIYLLRLFACMNALLTKRVKFFELINEIILLVPQIEELLGYLASKPKTMFSLANYEVASLEDQWMTFL